MAILETYLRDVRSLPGGKECAVGVPAHDIRFTPRRLLRSARELLVSRRRTSHNPACVVASKGGARPYPIRIFPCQLVAFETVLSVGF